MIAAAPEPTGPSYAGFLASRPGAAEETAIGRLVGGGPRHGGARARRPPRRRRRRCPLLRRARAEGVRITVETCPHYLTFAAEEVPDGATSFKCCPPIREARAPGGAVGGAAGRGHRPGGQRPLPVHARPQAARRSATSAPAWGGIAVAAGGAARRLDRRPRSAASAWPRWCGGWPRRPPRLAGLSGKGAIAVGKDADLVAFAPDERWTVGDLEHRNPVTPYAGRALTGVVRRTWLRGQVADGAPIGRLLAPRVRPRCPAGAVSSKVFGSDWSPPSGIGVAERRLRGQVLHVVLGAGFEVVAVGRRHGCSGRVGRGWAPARATVIRADSHRKRELDDRLHPSARPGEPRVRRRGGRGQRRVLRGPGEPGAARAARPSGPSSATRARSTTAGRPAAGARPGTTGRSCGSARPASSRGVVVDTAYFTGNYPPRASLDGAAVEGHCSVDELTKADWQPLLAAVGPGRQHAQPLPGLLRPPGHPRAAQHPSRTAASPGCGCTARRCPTRGWSTPGRSTSRRWRTAAAVTGGEQRVLRPAAAADRPRPGPRRWARAGRPPAVATPATTGWRCELACEGVVTPRRAGHLLLPAATPRARRPSPASARTARCRCCPRTRLQPDTRHRFVLDGRPRRGPGAAGRLPGRRDGPAAPVGAAHGRGAGGPGTALVRRAARRPGAGGARRGRRAAAGRRPARRGPVRWRASCRRRSPGCWTVRAADGRARTRGRAAAAPIGSRPSTASRGAAVPRRLRSAGRSSRSCSPGWRPAGPAPCRPRVADKARRTPSRSRSASAPTSAARTTSRPRSAPRPDARSRLATTRPSTG